MFFFFVNFVKILEKVKYEVFDGIIWVVSG